MLKLSLFYGNGVGVTKDPTLAFVWSLKAARAGLPLAMYETGAHYKLGVGVAANPAEAKRWYEQGAKAGSPEAMYGLAVVYDEGVGVPADAGLAADWMARAIRADSVQAIESLMLRPGKWSRATRQALQERLRAAGVYQGAANGDIDGNTRRAINALREQAAKP